MRTVLEVWILNHHYSHQLQDHTWSEHKSIVVPEPYQVGEEVELPIERPQGWIRSRNLYRPFDEYVKAMTYRRVAEA